MVELSKNKIRYRRCPFAWVAASAPAEKDETCFSLLSSKTLKSFCVKSRMELPFLSVTTESTSTNFDSFLITTAGCGSAGEAACGGGGSGCPCARKEAGAAHIAPAANHAPN